MNITTIGLDTAKSVFQVHGLDETGKAILKKKLQRSQMVPFFEKLERCKIYLEAVSFNQQNWPYHVELSRLIFRASP